MASRVPTNVAGFVLPGSLVDVLLNLEGGGREDGTGGGSTATLLQAVKVLAVDERLEAREESRANRKGVSAVTLEVTPDQANMLDLGQNSGTLSLSLRNPRDEQGVITEPATVANMRFYSDPAPAPATLPSPELLAAAAVPATRRQATASPSIITWRGGQRSRVWLTEEDR